MKPIVFKPKIDRWLYLVLVIMVGGVIVGTMMEGAILAGIILGGGLDAMWILAVTGVKYEIKDNKLGIRNFYRWTWIPIDKIATVEKCHGVAVQGAVSAVLSLDRVRMTLTDRTMLKSSLPVDISPKDADKFISVFKQLNPSIVVK